MVKVSSKDQCEYFKGNCWHEIKKKIHMDESQKSFYLLLVRIHLNTKISSTSKPHFIRLMLTKINDGFDPLPKGAVSYSGGALRNHWVI